MIESCNQVGGRCSQRAREREREREREGFSRLERCRSAPSISTDSGAQWRIISAAPCDGSSKSLPLIGIDGANHKQQKNAISNINQRKNKNKNKMKYRNEIKYNKKKSPFLNIFLFDERKEKMDMATSPVD